MTSTLGSRTSLHDQLAGGPQNVFSYMEQRIKDKIDEYDFKLAKEMKEQINKKVNKLGEEIATDINSIETKIKNLNTDAI